MRGKRTEKTSLLAEYVAQLGLDALRRMVEDPQLAEVPIVRLAQAELRRRALAA